MRAMILILSLVVAGPAYANFGHEQKPCTAPCVQVIKLTQVETSSPRTTTRDLEVPVRQRFGVLRTCFEKTALDRATVRIKVEIAADGTAKRATATTLPAKISRKARQQLEDCLTSNFTRLRFPRQRSVVATFTLELTRPPTPPVTPEPTSAHNVKRNHDANLMLRVTDTSGTPISGAVATLEIQGAGSTSQRVFPLGPGGSLVPLELPMHFDYYISDVSQVPPCKPRNDVHVKVKVTVELNGQTSADTASFNNCTYTQAVLAMPPPTTNDPRAAMTLTFKFPADRLAPTTSMSYERTPIGLRYELDGAGHWTSRSTMKRSSPAGTTSCCTSVSLSCADASRGFASGCARIEFTIDGGATVIYKDPFITTGDAPHVVRYRAIDAATNAEPWRTHQFPQFVVPTN